MATSRITPPLDRDTLTKGYRQSALMARLSMRAARLEALERFCQPAPRVPSCMYDARKPENRALPCERLHNLIIEGIEQGWATEEKLVEYLSDLYAIYAPMIAKHAHPDDVSFLGAAREKSEAAAAIHRAEMLPTPENRAHAVRELVQDVVVSTAYAKTLRSGSAA